jgi:alpha-L-glutamate ligase-like protein
LKRILESMRRAGVIGINQRNSRYTLRWNPRHLYPLVDDKLRTKRLCQAAGIPTPKLLGVATHQHAVQGLPQRIASHERFVLKPSRGAMGNGILVVKGRLGARFVRAGGRELDETALLYHAASIVSGLYAIAGQPDAAMVEELLIVHPELAEVSTDGVPDIRVIVYRGIPVMAMTRLPTSRSGGRANLHQGAVGVGIDLASGTTMHAALENRPVKRHPDSRAPLLGRQIPHFARAVEAAVRATDQTGLGYVGADIVIDANLGPVVLELNARPGLAVQVVNRAGLLPRLSAVDASFHPERGLDERIALGREIAAARSGATPVHVL